MDLARYVEATFAGSTPGQQSAQLCLVTAAELKAAGQDLMFAMVMKAKLLADYLRCTDAEAWVLLAKERMELMAYVHQKQPQAAPAKAGELPIAYLVPDGAPQPLLDWAGGDDEELADVTNEKSPGEGQEPV